MERVEKIKAKERMSLGGQGKEDVPTLQTRDAVASQSGFGSGKNFERAKFISDNADETMIKELDEGKLSIKVHLNAFKLRLICHMKKYTPLQLKASIYAFC